MIIGISGRAQAGKDTIARIIRDFNPEARIIHFGDALKDVTSNAFGLYRDLMDDQWYKSSKYRRLDITVRELLQKVGDIFRENFYQDIWVDRVIDQLTEYETWIIPDVRFPNEKKAIEDAGGIVIRVERPNIPQMNHISETALDDTEFPYTIQNDGTLIDLRVKVKELWEQL